MIKLLAIFLAGTGIALTCIVQLGDMHHPTVTIGVLLLLAAILLRWNHLIAILRRDKLKPLWFTVPYLVILASAVVSHFIYWNSGNSTLFILLMIEFGFLYLLGKNLGKIVFWSLPPLAVLTSLVLTFSLGRYDLCNLDHISAVAMILGVLFAPAAYRWLVLGLVAPGILFSASEEGLLALIVLALLMLARRDLSWKMLFPITTTLMASLRIFATPLHDKVYPRLNAARFSEPSPDLLLHGRWVVYERAIRDFNFVGTGWEYNTLCWIPEVCCVIHNVPLLIATQLGIPAALAWLCMMTLAFFKTQYKYAFAVVLSISMVDHMFWTFLMVMPWLLIGIAVNESEKDYIFKKEVASEKFAVQPAMAAASAMDGG